MQNRRKWIPFSAFALVALLSVLLLFRHQIIGKLLQVAIETKTSGQITLSTEKLYMNPATWDIVVTKPTFNFNNVFLSSSDSLMLHQIQFRKLIISGLSFRRLLFNKDVVCTKLIMEKPVIKIKNLAVAISRPKISRSFDPFIVIKILKNRSFGQTDLVLDINKTEIRFGKVDILHSAIKNGSGSARYTVSIGDLKSTGRKKTEKNELTYKKLSASVGSLKYTFYREGYTVTLDTAVYRSDTKHLGINGLTVKQTGSDSLPGLKLFKGDIVLRGIVLDDTTALPQQGLHLRLAELSNGTLRLVTAGKRKGNNGPYLLKLFFDNFPTFTVDTARMANFTLRLKNIDNKSSLLCKKLNIVAHRFWADSLLLQKGLTALSWKNTAVHFDALTLENNDNRFSSGKTQYSEHEKQLIAERVSFINKRSGSSLQTEKTVVQNLLAKPLLEKRVQEINIILDKPRGIFNGSDSSSTLSPAAIIKKFGRYFTLGTVTVSGGNFQFSGQSGLSGSAYNLNALIRHPRLKKLIDTLPELDVEKLNLRLSELNLSDSGKNFFLKSNNLLFDKNLLSSDKLNLHFAGNRMSLSAQTGKILMKGVRLNPLLFHKNLYLWGLELHHPHVTLLINRDVAPPQRERNRYFIENFLISGGEARITFVKNGDTLKLTSAVEATAQNISQKVQFTALWNNAQQKNITLRHFSLETANSRLKAKEIRYGDRDSSLFLKDIRLNTQYKTQNIKSNLKSITFARLHTQPTDPGMLHWQKITAEGDSLTVSKTDDTKTHSEKANRAFPPFAADTLSVHYNCICKNDAQRQWVLDTVKALYFAPEGFVKAGESFFDKIDFQIKTASFLKKNSPAYLTAKSVVYSKEDKILSAQSLSYTGKITDTVQNGTTPYTIAGKGIKVYRPQYFQSLHQTVSDSVVLNSAFLNIRKAGGRTRKREQPGKNQEKETEQLKLNNLICKNFNIVYSAHDTVRTLLSRAAVRADSVQWSQHASFTASPFYFHTLFIDFKRKNITAQDSMYSSGLRSVTFSLPEQRLVLDTLFLIPNYKPEEFFKKARYQTDRVYFVADKTVIRGFAVDTLLRSGIFKIRSVFLQSPEIQITRDKRYPMPPDLEKKMPLEWIRSLRVPFYMDSVYTNNAHITYSEIDEKSSEPGTIRFTSTGIIFKKISNIPSLLRPADALKISVQGKLMGASHFEMNITLPYKNNPRHNFWLQAKSDNIDLTDLNSVTQNLMGITVKSGSGNVLIPFAGGNDTLLKGKMIFKYRKLKFGLYNREKATAYKGIAAPFVNFMLNNIMIRPNNPRLFGKTETGIIWFKRDKQKSFLNYIWKGVLSGALSTMGFNTKNQRMEKREAQKRNKEKEKRHRKENQAPHG